MRVLTSATALSLMIVVAGSCSRFQRGATVKFAGSTTAPAAQASARMWTDKAGNARMDLQVAQLAKPSRLEEKADTYAVWAQTREGRNYLLGHLRVDDNGEAELNATVPAAQQFRIVITAEQQWSPPEPGPTTVMASGYLSSEVM